MIARTSMYKYGKGISVENGGYRTDDNSGEFSRNASALIAREDARPIDEHENWRDASRVRALFVAKEQKKRRKKRSKRSDKSSFTQVNQLIPCNEYLEEEGLERKISFRECEIDRICTLSRWSARGFLDENKKKKQNVGCFY